MHSQPSAAPLSNNPIPDAERSILREGDDDLSVDLLEEKQGRGEIGSGEVLHHGTREEDGPVTREALFSPREDAAVRRAGDQSLDLTRMRAHVLVVDEVGRTSVCPRR